MLSPRRKQHEVRYFRCKFIIFLDVVVTAEEEKVRDAAGYAAIAEIHREMDDDQSGSIDRKETSGVGFIGSFAYLSQCT